MPKRNYKDKPYNRCLHCDYRNNGCDGPRTSAMELERWREFMRDMKEAEGLTYVEIAERSGLSVKTIEKKLSPGGDGQDIMRETARLIENAIIGSSNQYPCYVAFLESVPEHSKNVMEVEAEMAELRKNIEHIHKSYQEELKTVREDAQRKIDHLKDQIAYLRGVNDRNAKIIDKLMED